MKRLKECPESPNCVSSQTTQESKKMDPIPFVDSRVEVIDRIIKALKEIPRSKLEERNDDHLHFTVKSQFFGFIDDVEFLIDDANKLIHFRSASRTGYSDLGVNKKRMIAISKKLLK